MGRAEITSHIADGQYNIELTFARDRWTITIANLNSQIAVLTTYIATLPAGAEKNLAELKKTALELRIAFMEDTQNMPADLATTAWCADLTTDLADTVGTIEVPGERGTVLIQPGFDSNAIYDSDRDGQLSPMLNQTPEGTFYNWAMLPGWQKWMPTYRFGTISNLIGDVCDVTLEAATSSQQSLDINQGSELTGVSIDYMGGGGSVFVDGDEVVIKFTDQDYNQPVVIGFKNNPRGLSGSAIFDGIDSYLSMPASSQFARRTGVFTIDFWVKIEQELSVDALWIGQNYDPPQAASFAVSKNTGGTPPLQTGLHFGLLNFGSGIVFTVQETGTMHIGIWHHIAFIRGWGNDADIFTITLDGISLGTTNYAGSDWEDLFTGPMTIGAHILNGGAITYNRGKMTDIRFSDIVRWSENFTLPSEPHTPDANDIYLLPFDGSFDDSTSNHTVSVHGNMQLSNDNPWDNVVIASNKLIVTSEESAFISASEGGPTYTFDINPNETGGILSSNTTAEDFETITYTAGAGTGTDVIKVIDINLDQDLIYITVDSAETKYPGTPSDLVLPDPGAGQEWESFFTVAGTWTITPGGNFWSGAELSPYVGNNDLCFITTNATRGFQFFGTFNVCGYAQYIRFRPGVLHPIYGPYEYTFNDFWPSGTEWRGTGATVLRRVAL